MVLHEFDRHNAVLQLAEFEGTERNTAAVQRWRPRLRHAYSRVCALLIQAAVCPRALFRILTAMRPICMAAAPTMRVEQI
jgi:hypothetical protein